MRKVQLVIASLLLILLLVSCAPKAAAPVPQAPVPAAAPAAAAPAATAKAAWQEQWEKTLAAAKKESRVTVIGASTSTMRNATSTGFKDAYGLYAEFLTGRGSAQLMKVETERRAGLYLTDLYIGGASPTLTQAKPAGLLEPLDSALILPEVTEPKYWYGGKFPWVDKDHMVINLSLHASPTIVVNTNLVKSDDIKSYRDLLNPKWRGKVILNDPSLPGAGQQYFQAMLELMGEDFIKELAATKPTVMRDERLQLEWLAHGKVAIVLNPKPEVVGELVPVAPSIGVAIPVEGLPLTQGGGSICWFKNAPHPNAAKVFINWILTKQGQTIFAPAAWHQSARVDVSTAHLPVWRIRQEGVKYVDLSTEEAPLLRLEKAVKLAKELIEPLITK